MRDQRTAINYIAPSYLVMFRVSLWLFLHLYDFIIAHRIGWIVTITRSNHVRSLSLDVIIYNK